MRSKAAPRGIGAAPLSGSGGVRLGILDQVPARAGGTQQQALRETIGLAQLAEELGYTRYWLAEHHNSEALSCASPEVLVPVLLSATSRIRVGTGGVMLPHYSALKVAESFRLLESLFPGRVDLGLGRAPGSDGLTAAALQPAGVPAGADHFPEQVRDLLGYLAEDLPAEHPFRSVRAMPRIETSPEVWLLGSGNGSAQVAAWFGCAFCHAHFINARDTEAAIDLYRQQFRPGLTQHPRVAIGVQALCAETDELAERLSMSRFLWWVKIMRGLPGPFPSVEEAVSFPYDVADREVLDKLRRRSIYGSPETVAGALRELVLRTGAEELVVLTITHDPAARRRSYELLARVWGLG